MRESESECVRESERVERPGLVPVFNDVVMVMVMVMVVVVVVVKESERGKNHPCPRF